MISQSFRDPEQMTEAIAPHAPGVCVHGPERGPFLGRIEIANTRSDAFALFKVGGLGLSAAMDAYEDEDYLSLNFPLVGRFDAKTCCGWSHVTQDTCFVRAPCEPFRARKGAHAEILVLNGFLSLIDECLHAAGTTREQWLEQMPRTLSLRSTAGGALERYATFLWREAQRDSPLLRSDVAGVELYKGLLGTLLLAAGLHGGVDSAQSRATPAHLRRATDFIDANLSRPIVLLDVATAAGVHTRTLQRAFRAHYGRSVMCFVREQRLLLVHARLVEAEPGVISVTETALAHGFIHLGRFARDYRRRFGELPSQTLTR